MTKTIALLLSMILLAATASAGPSQVTGSVLDQNGAPITVSHAHVGRRYDVPVATVAAGRDGRFSITTTERGLVMLKLTGVGHQTLEVPLWLDGGEAIALVARLAPQRRLDTIDVVKVTGEFNHFSYKSGRTMTKQADGTYVLELDAERPFRYQLLGVARGNYEGQSPDAFEWRAELNPKGQYQEGYRGVAVPRNGKVRITLDPSRLNTIEGKSRVTFADPASLAAALFEYQRAIEGRTKAYSDAIVAHHAAGQPYQTFKYDWSPAMTALADARQRASRPLLRQAMAVELWGRCFSSRTTACDPKTVTGLLDEVSPDSTLWPWMDSLVYTTGTLVARALDDSDAETKAYVMRMLDTQRDRRMKTYMLYSLLNKADAAGRIEESAVYYHRLLKEYPNTEEARRAVAHTPDRKIRPGLTLPAFSVASLTDPATSITNAAGANKVFLVDVWTTWCPGCKLSMPTLHRLYEKYRGAGLEILSVSGDDSPGEVHEFMAKKETPMPWLHGYIGSERGGPFMKLMEAPGYPTYVLTDRDGKILLKGHSHEEVEAAITKALGLVTSQR